MTYREIPGISFGGGSNIYAHRGNNTVFHWANNYSIAANVNKMKGSHNLKVGFEFRLMDSNAGGASQPSGSFTFDARIAGSDFAAFLLGIPTSGSIRTGIPITDFNYYQAYYMSDAWQLGRKLTFNLGLRWELPGSIAEKHNGATVLLPGALDPVTNVVGTLALVSSSLYDDRHVLEIKHNLLAPRLGLAYRVTDDTVLRAGYGLTYIPPDTLTSVYSNSSLVNSATTSFDNTQLSAANYRFMQNPFPSGITQSTGRSNANFMLSYANKTPLQSITGVYPYQPNSYMQQWNFSVGHQFAGDWMADLGYGGSRGTHLPLAGSINLNQLPIKFWNSTDAKQANRPYPYFNAVNSSINNVGNSAYHSMQVKVEKRFQSGGVLLVSYTWAKFISNTDSALGYMEAKAASSGAGTGTTGGYQNYADLASEYSLSSFDVPHRLTASYVLDLPFGNGKKFAHYGGVAGGLVSGWALNGIATFQTGFPLAFTSVSTGNSLGSYGIGSLRPNVASGCDAAIEGSAQSRLSKWFNTACFSTPTGFTVGNASRTDPKLRSHGINNWDLSLLKTTKIKERVNLQFRTEFFNLFNRVRFAPPITQVGNPNFGKVTVQLNQPRLIQFSLRLGF